MIGRIVLAAALATTVIAGAPSPANSERLEGSVGASVAAPCIIRLEPGGYMIFDDSDGTPAFVRNERSVPEPIHIRPGQDRNGNPVNMANRTPVQRSSSQPAQYCRDATVSTNAGTSHDLPRSSAGTVKHFYAGEYGGEIFARCDGKYTWDVESRGVGYQTGEQCYVVKDLFQGRVVDRVICEASETVNLTASITHRSDNSHYSNLTSAVPGGGSGDQCLVASVSTAQEDEERETDPVETSGYCPSSWTFSELRALESERIRLGFIDANDTEGSGPHLIASCSKMIGGEINFSSPSKCDETNSNSDLMQPVREDMRDGSGRKACYLNSSFSDEDHPYPGIQVITLE
jgi:hypothetical protein|tara:strand:+ start:9768 stop:10805 length:1038 start_codon:yes stop_codon:yes gene_type:complete